MLISNSSNTDLLTKRFSCRIYKPEPIQEEKRENIKNFINSLTPGPFGSCPRFEFLAANETDTKTLRSLGTYGFIKNPAAFIVGAMQPWQYNLEDFGYLMETIILYATSQELGTCWLGGTFTKSRFAQAINLLPNETLPAVTSIGEFVTPGQKRKGIASQVAGSHQRLSWKDLFFHHQLDQPLDYNEAEPYSIPLEMVRLGPSASNKQPWRIVKHNQFFRFYLRRTPGYREGLIKKFLDLCDLQRLDMGIAMCHFELTAAEMGLQGSWMVEEIITEPMDEFTEYIVSWLVKKSLE
jgi:hypothetical protein